MGLKNPHIEFRGSLSASDPRKHPVLIVGQLNHLSSINFSDVSCKLQPRVEEEVSHDYIIYIPHIKSFLPN